MEYEPSEPFRIAFENRDESLSMVARRIGWVSIRGQPQTSRVARTLGLMPDPDVVEGHRRSRIKYETAVMLCRALDRVEPRGAWQ
jgi:hypothetical protein